MTFEIGINGAVLDAQRHGISRYTTQLLTHLSRIDAGEIEICVFTDAEKDFENVTEIDLDKSGTFERMVWDTAGFPRRANSMGLDVIHSPDKGPFIGGDIPLVSTIHDLLPYLYSDERKFPNGRYWQLSVRRQATLSDAIITVSESTKRDLIEIFDVNPDSVYVTPLGTNFSPPSETEVDRVSQEYEIPPSAFNVLYVGNYNDRKNVDSIVKACRSVSEDVTDLNLLLAGSSPPKSKLRDLAGPFRDSVKFLGYVPDDSLEALYGAADVFAYPSSYEGFGLPVLEAMACGTPVITSNTSSLPEVAGDAGITVDPENVPELSDALKEVHSDKQIRADMRKAGLERAEQMTWDETARLTLDVYEELITDDRIQNPREAGHIET